MVCGGLRREREKDKELWVWWFWSRHVGMRRGERGRVHSSASFVAYNLTTGRREVQQRENEQEGRIVE